MNPETRRMINLLVIAALLELASARLYTPPPDPRNRFVHEYLGLDRIWLVISMHLIFGTLCFFASYAVEYRRMRLGDGEIIGLVPRFPFEWGDDPEDPPVAINP